MPPPKSESETHQVTVEQRLYRNEESGFTVARVTPERGGAPFIAAGVFTLEVSPGDVLEVDGCFEEHPRYGPRFRVRALRPRPPSTADGIRRYLTSGRVKGIGPKLADRLLAHFGEQTLHILEREPRRVLEVPGVGQRKLEELEKVLAEGREQREVLVYLQGLGLGPALAQQVWQEMGRDAPLRIQEDPYSLCRFVHGIGFRTADRLARALGIDADAPARLRAGVAHTLREALDAGHLCLPLDALRERAARLLGCEVARVDQGIAHAREAGEVVAVRPDLPVFADGAAVAFYLPALLAAEEETMARLRALEAAPRPPAPPRVRDDGASLALTEEQSRAVDALLSAKVGLLTGGPGVGKTTVLRHVVDAYAAAGFEVALASPTGRAARRLAEACGREAHTLHRLFRLQPGEVEFLPQTHLEADVLIIDETSMVDLLLFMRVLRRVPDETIMILVGDPDQLPSVGPGSLLADLLASRRLPTARLTQVFRQREGGRIVESAHCIQRGEVPRIQGGEDYWFVERDDPAAGARLIERLFCERIPLRYGLEPRRDIQILAPMHRGTTGVDALNQRLQAAFAPEGREGVERRGGRFLPGDRVMQVRNDYDRGLMNGELGEIVGIDEGARQLHVRFDGVEHLYQASQLDDLELAWAVTVHKSQGGEFPAVILPLFTEHRLMLRRRVLYTAVTRAKTVLVIVGHRRALEAAVRQDREEKRHGHFLPRLMGHAVPRVDELDLRP